LRGLLVALIIGRIGLVCTGQSAPSRPRQRPSAAKHSTLRCLAAVCVTRYMKKYRLPRACATNPPQSQEPRWVEEFGKSCLVLPMIDIANDNSRSSQDFALPGCANSSCPCVPSDHGGLKDRAPLFTRAIATHLGQRPPPETRTGGSNLPQGCRCANLITDDHTNRNTESQYGGARLL